MSKFFTAAALALAVFCASDAAAAASLQTSSVRVGPATDDKPAATPQKTDKKPADPAAKNQRQQEQKSDPANAAVKKETQDVEIPSVTASTTTAPPTSNDSSTTSDAPPKSNPAAPLAVGTAEKNGRTEAGGDGATSKTPSSTKSDPPPSNTTTNTTTNPPPSANTTTTNNTAPSTTPANAATSRPATTPTPAPASASMTGAALTSVYRIGVGDVLDVRLLNLPDGRQSTLFTVLAGGVLEYPLLRDPVTAAGMTTDELAAQLVAELRHRGVYDRPQVRVGIREYASHAVLVSGLVNDPGTKILRREAIPLYVVVAEAQPKPEAGRAVVFSHSTGKTTNVDLNDAAAMGLLVQQGDVVNLVVRPQEFFYVGGEINAPGQKDFHTGMTLTQAVLASGGVSARAGGRVKVSRQGADGRLASQEYTLKEIEDGVVPDPPIRAGDRIEISRAKK